MSARRRRGEISLIVAESIEAETAAAPDPSRTVEDNSPRRSSSSSSSNSRQHQQLPRLYHYYNNDKPYNNLHEDGYGDEDDAAANPIGARRNFRFWEKKKQETKEEEEEEEDQELLLVGGGGGGGKGGPRTRRIMMTARDRTGEFANAIQSMQSRSVARAAQLRNPRQARTVQGYSNFMLFSKNIGKNIASTYAKLEKLALLAKKKSIFEDRQMEIDELTTIIKTDLGSLNQQIAKLQELGRKQRESSSSSKAHHIASHSSSVVVALQSKLANMSNHFKSVLQVRSENMKDEQNRREQFTQGQVTTMLPPGVVSGRQGSLLLQEQDSTSVSIDLEPAMMGQVQAQIYDDTDSYVRARAETMQNIESTIVELGGIFQQLAHMVQEQEEMVERIDSNIEHTELNVEAAHAEILKYFQSVTNNRWLMIKIFAVLIFFFIFFVVFLA